MAQASANQNEEVVLGQEIDHVRLITLNQPRRLNVITFNVVSLLAKYLEKWEKDDDAELILMKGAGRAFSAGGDLKMFYDGRLSNDSCLEVVYRMYWLCYHIHTYKKPQVSLAHGISMGGGASLMVPMKFSVVTEKTVFATPEASVGFHVDCGFSYMLSQLPGHLGEFLALTGTRLDGKELVAAGLATHFVLSEKLPVLETRLVSLNKGDMDAVKSVIEEFSTKFQIGEESVLSKKAIIDECFSKDSVEEIIKAMEVKANQEGNGWIASVRQGLKRSSPTSLKIILQSIREGRTQSLSECLRKEFRVTMNILRASISDDVYEEDDGVLQEWWLYWVLLVTTIPFVLYAMPPSTSRSFWYKIILLNRPNSENVVHIPYFRRIKFCWFITSLKWAFIPFLRKGIRAVTIDKDNSPKWKPSTLEAVDQEKIDLVFRPFEEDLELKIPENDSNRWEGKYEDSPYATSK